MMKILYIYRHPDMGFSIGKVFKPIEEEMKKYAEVDSVYLPVPNYSPKGLWQNIKAARKATKAKCYDVVHITGAEHYLIPFLRGQKLVVTVHDLGFCTILEHKLTYRIKYLLFVTSLKWADLVTFISEKSENEADDFIKLKKSKCITIHNPVGEEFVHTPKAFNAEKPVVLHIGTKEHKNLERSVEALAGINCTLRIIGKVDDTLIARMKELGIDYSIGLNLTDEEILREYQQADIINFPTLYEGFGMPVIEGQATGRAVITSTIEPVKTVAGDGAFMVNPEDVNSIHAAYEEVINDEAKRNDVIARGTKNVERFRLKDIAYKYYSKYLEITPPHRVVNKLLQPLTVIMPWRLKRWVLTHVYHYDIHPSAKIGLAYVFPKYLKMEEGARIDHFTVGLHLDRIVMGRKSSVGRSNWITGFATMSGSKHFAHDYSRRSELIMGHDSAITKHHHIDCTNYIHIGDYVTIAGYNSQLLTHSIDVYEGRQDSHPIEIGDYCFVSTGVRILGGSRLPDHSVLAAGAVLGKKLEQPYALYGGVPAKFIKEIPHDAKYMTRTEGFVW